MALPPGLPADFFSFVMISNDGPRGLSGEPDPAGSGGGGCVGNIGDVRS